MCKIRLDDSCLNHLTNIPVGFTCKSSYIITYIILRNHIPKILCILLTRGAYAPDAICIATPLDLLNYVSYYRQYTLRYTCVVTSPYYSIVLTNINTGHSFHKKVLMLSVTVHLAALFHVQDEDFYLLYRVSKCGKVCHVFSSIWRSNCRRSRLGKLYSMSYSHPVSSKPHTKYRNEFRNKQPYK